MLIQTDKDKLLMNDNYLSFYHSTNKQEHKIDLTETKFTFKGVGEKEQNEYEAEIEFYGSVDVEVSVYTTCRRIKH